MSYLNIYTVQYVKQKINFVNTLFEEKMSRQSIIFNPIKRKYKTITS